MFNKKYSLLQRIIEAALLKIRLLPVLETFILYKTTVQLCCGMKGLITRQKPR